MLRLLVALAVLGIVPAPISAQSAAPRRDPFDETVAAMVADLHRRDPIRAEEAGDLGGADALPDLSAAGHAAFVAALRSWRAKIDATAQFSDTLDRSADRRAALDALDAELIEDEMLAPWRSDPSVYVNAVGSAVFLPLAREREDARVRFAHVAARLPGVPALVDAALANLDRPTRVATELTTKRLAGTIALYESLPKRAADAGIDAATRARIDAALPAALDALRRFSAFAAGPLLARSDRDPRIGAAAYDRLFPAVIGTDVTRAELVARARARIAGVRAEMYRIAAGLYPSLVGGPLPRGGDDDVRITRVVRAVLDVYAKRHATADGFVASIQGDVTEIRAFLAQSKLVELPAPDTLRVRETPAFQAGVAGASLTPAGPYAPLEPSYYNVDPIPADWDAARVESALREANAPGTKILTIHEALPGHYVQLRYANDNPSLVRRLLGNGSFIEGYACWTEEMMLRNGYGNGDPALRLTALKWRLREATNAVIDAEYHAGTLNEEAAMRMLVDGAFQEQSEAQGKWHRLRLSHVQLSTYYAGLDAIETAQRELDFDDGAMVRGLLALGSVEPRYVKPLLTKR